MSIPSNKPKEESKYKDGVVTLGKKEIAIYLTAIRRQLEKTKAPVMVQCPIWNGLAFDNFAKTMSVPVQAIKVVQTEQGLYLTVTIKTLGVGI